MQSAEYILLQCGCKNGCKNACKLCQKAALSTLLFAPTVRYTDLFNFA